MSESDRLEDRFQKRFMYEMGRSSGIYIRVHSIPRPPSEEQLATKNAEHYDLIVPQNANKPDLGGKSGLFKPLHRTGGITLWVRMDRH